MTQARLGNEIIATLQQILPPQLPMFLARQRWFGGKARRILSAAIADTIPIALELTAAVFVVRVEYAEGPSETYSLPFVLEEESAPSFQEDPGVLSLEVPGTERRLYLRDALKDEAFLKSLLSGIQKQSVLQGQAGRLQASRTIAFEETAGDLSVIAATPMKAEQSNSSAKFGDRLILKFFRRLEDGVNPDLEVGSILTEVAHFPHTPRLAGSIEYRPPGGGRMTQAILQAFVANQGDAWQFTLNSLNTFYAKIAEAANGGQVFASQRDHHSLPAPVRDSLAQYLEAAALLGRRTAELHLALASVATDPAFAAQPFTAEFQQALVTACIHLVEQVSSLLRAKMLQLPAGYGGWRDSWKDQVIERFRAAFAYPIEAARTRIHGDYHLGQVLYTGNDFAIIDFEGEPARPLAERRLKRSPLQDVAGMLRSFHYAAFASLMTAASDSVRSDSRLRGMQSWAEAWYRWTSERFLAEYFQTSRGAPFLPASAAQANNLLEAFLIEKAVYELGYELNNRPAWIEIPLRGLWSILSDAGPLRREGHA